MSAPNGIRSNAWATAPNTRTIVLDDQGAPLVRVGITGPITDEDFREYLGTSDRVIQRGTPYVLLYDVVHGASITAVQRRMQAEWIQRNRPALRQLCKGAAFAMPGQIMRGALTAILWIAPLPFETHVTSVLADAERWVRERLPQAGPAAKGAEQRM
jgi:hypothetical protein